VLHEKFDVVLYVNRYNTQSIKKEYSIKKFENDFSIHELELEYVYGNLSQERKEEIFKMWEDHTPLKKEAQIKRVEQIVYIIKKDDHVVGVSTAYLRKPPRREEKYYFFRTFIQPDIRGVIGAGFPDILRATNQRMQEFNDIEPLAGGMVVITENPKLKRPGSRKLFRDGGWKYQGQTEKKQDIWFYSYA